MRALTPRTFMHKKGPFPVVFLGLLLAFFSVVNTMNGQRNENQFVVVLDAGHGGHDPGNLGNGYLEKNIALSIVLNAGAILERTPGIKVVYTRKDDTFVDLYVRGEIANKANADLFVSVHCDSHTSNAHGAGTFVLGLHANKQNFEIAKKENSVIYLEDNYESRYADYDINSPESVIGLTIMQEEFLEQSIALAKGIQQNFSRKLKRKDRQVKQAGFIVLHQTFMPSVLVETGFLTNDNEGAYLNSRRGQLEMGTSIAEAIIAYRGGVQSGGVSTTDVSVSTPVPADSEVAVNKDINPPKNTDAAKEFAKNPGSNPLAEKAQETVADGSPDQNMEANKEKLVMEDPNGPETKEVVTNPVSEPSDNTTDEDQGKIQQEVVLSNGVSSVEKEPKETTSNNTTKASEVPTPKEVVTKKPPKNTVKNIVFKVQLMASKKEIALQSSNFRGLRTLSKERFNEFYRYMYGNTESYAQAKILKSNADARGYPTSYIVAYKDGVRIPTPEAIKLVSE